MNVMNKSIENILYKDNNGFISNKFYCSKKWFAFKVLKLEKKQSGVFKLVF